MAIKVSRADFEAELGELKAETSALFRQLEENGSEELLEEKNRVDRIVEGLKRLIDEKTAISANAASSSAYACLACNQQVPMMPPPRPATGAPSHGGGDASPTRSLRGGGIGSATMVDASLPPYYRMDV